MFQQTFRYISNIPHILYPSINFSKYDIQYDINQDTQPIINLSAQTLLFISINRFERKKNLSLAIESFDACSNSRLFSRMKLIMAGGYDEQNKENIEHYQELKLIATKKKLIISEYPSMDGQIIFLRSFSDQQRQVLFQRCIAVIYTPMNEHFGIVPVEGNNKC
jgi:alpha-1,3/alpha-1,6-mannosyltransferase